MTAKKWLKYTSIIVFFTLGSMFSVNYVVDPLWMYSFDNPLNSRQYSMDDRQLKTNKMFFRLDSTIDTIILGSSRTSYISQKNFMNKNAFNFAEDNMWPFEMKGTIQAAKDIQKKDFQVIIIGFDFFSSSKGQYLQKQMKEQPSQAIYLENAKSNLYRLKATLSLSTLRYSLMNLKSYFRKDKHIIYDRNNIKSYLKRSREEEDKAYQGLIKYFKEHSYKTYIYNENIKQTYQSLKNNNKNSKFIVFTTPVQSTLYAEMIKMGLKEDYKRWLKELVEVFEEVYDFTGVNSVNINKNNYRDPQHFDPRIGTLVADRIMNTQNNDTPKDFGILLTNESIDDYLKSIDIRDDKHVEKYKMLD